MKKTERNLRKGFTLLEVLVVVIISIVVIMFAAPAYKKTQEKNRYIAAQGVLLDLANGVKMVRTEYPNLSDSTSRSVTTSNMQPYTDPSTAISGSTVIKWMITNKYISPIPFTSGATYMGYSFKINLNGGANCCTKSTSANAIACMNGSNEITEYKCAWVTLSGDLGHN